MNNFILMIQFFTRIPIKKQIEFKEESYGKSTYLLPMVGLIIGLCIFFINKTCVWLKLPKMVNALILLLSSVIITGGIHLDGMADSSDAIFSYRSREKMLEIMKDPHLGVNGVIALFIALLSKFVFYSYVNIIPLALSFVVGRLCIIFSASFGEYARETGMATAIIKYNCVKSFFKSLIITLFIFLFFKKYILFLIIILLLNYYMFSKINIKLKGITGDTLGFVCEVSELFFLFIIILGDSLCKF